MAMTLKELSLVAELDYERLRDKFKAKALDFFDRLDLDGDGALTCPELLNSNLEGKFGEEFIQHVFYSLDEDGKGFLNFRESLTLYYLCMYSTRLCDGCQRNIPHGLGYTCFKCWKERASSRDDLQTFCLCLECYSKQDYQHSHNPAHLLHDFVLFDNLLHSKPSSPAAPMPAPIRAVEQTLKQCIVCGDHHESAAPGFTCDVHMARMRDSTEFVCEWCFSYLCSKCGNLFRDSTTRAEPGKWLQKFVCPTCHQRNIATDCYDASLKGLQKALASGVELLQHCRTCEIKQRNGTLFWIVNGTNKAPSPPPSTPQTPQPRPSAPPAVSPMPRNYKAGNSNPSPAGGYGNPHVNNVSRIRGGHVPGSSRVVSRSGGGSMNSMNPQNQDGSGSSRGGSLPSRGGGHSMNRTNPQADQGANFPSRSGVGRGHGVSSGYPNRNNGIQDSQASVSSHSSGSSGSSNMGRPTYNRPNSFEENAAAAMRTINGVVNVANKVANLFNGMGGGGGDQGDGGNGGGMDVSGCDISGDGGSAADTMFGGLDSVININVGIDQDQG